MIKINLIPPEYAEAQAKKEQQIILGILSGVVIVVMLVVWIWHEKRARDLQAEIVQAERSLQQVQAIVDSITDLEAKNRKLAEKRDVIVNLNRSRLVFPVFFEDLLPLIPSDVWVTEIKLERSDPSSSDYRLSSRAGSNFAVATWLTNLQQSTNFSRVKIDRIQYDYASADKQGPATLSFQLTFTYQHQGQMPLSDYY